MTSPETDFVELQVVRGIRHRPAGWNPIFLAIMLLSFLDMNRAWRIGDYDATVLTFGLLLSFVTADLTALTGWHGGKLVFDSQSSTKQPD